MTTDAIADVLTAITRAAGLNDHVTSHVLRHTFGTELTRLGVDLVTVAELMGYASLGNRAAVHQAERGRHAASSGLADRGRVSRGGGR